MVNWSTDEKKFKKSNPKEYKLWRIIQLINYGLDGEKLILSEVKNSWEYIKNKIDEPSKNYLQYLIWGNQQSSTMTNKSSLKLS
ncbi:MAG: hypothetical protein AAB872_00040 [Patescibacteria group bacterium]